MSEIDGFYRYAGTEVRWNRDGIRLTHAGRIEHTTWDSVTGARRAGVTGGFVQIEIAGRRAERQPGADRFAFPVSSEHDAARFLTQFNWWATRGYPERHAQVELLAEPVASRVTARAWWRRLRGSRRG